MQRDYKAILLGIFYILLSGLAFFNAFYYQTPYNIFWFCYVGMFIIGLGILLKSSAVIKSQLYILFIPDIIWILDFIFYLAGRGDSLFGIVDYFFLSAPIFAKLVTLQHFFTVPIALYFSYHFKSKSKYIFLASYLQIILIFLISRFFTTNEENINCVYHFCGEYSFSISSTIYPVFWFVGAIIMVYLSYITIDKTFTGRERGRKE